MWVKICGLTRKEDAFPAAELGADALGFVLTKMSRKFADPVQVSKWIDQIKGVEKVGVFYGESTEGIMDIAINLGLDTIQIHSPITEEYIPLLRKVRIIAAFKDTGSLYCKEGKFDTKEVLIELPGIENSAKKDIPVRILIDPSMGRGVKAEWRPYPFPFILAGGLTPGNVREAIKKAGPAGVDVSTGVDLSPGVKDISLMERFIREAKS